jgi:hypothetical protein
MDIVSSFSRHKGAKAEAASPVAVFDAMSLARTLSTEDGGNDVCKCQLATPRRPVAVAKSLPDADRPETREPLA